MATYKVSVVVIDSDHPGAIVNLDSYPKPGETLMLNGETFLVVETLELMPPREDFYYLHVTCRPIEKVGH